MNWITNMSVSPKPLGIQQETDKNGSENTLNIDPIIKLQEDARTFLQQQGFCFEDDFRETHEDEQINFYIPHPDGRKKIKCWMKCNYLSKRDDTPGLCLTFGAFHPSLPDHDTKTFWSDANYQFTEKERKIWQERLAEQKQQASERAKEEKQIADEKANWCIDKFANATPRGSSPYFDRKKITPGGIRYEIRKCHSEDGFTQETIALIPLRNIEGKIRALQEIYPSKRVFQENSEPRDKNVQGKYSGCFFTFGKLENGKPICICEGAATAGSVFESSNITTVMVVSRTNILNVGKELKRKYPSSEIIICGDDDVDTTGNPGRNDAIAAAQHLNCKVVFPKFPDGKNRDEIGEAYTDFNDLMLLCSKEEVKKQIQKKDLEENSNNSRVFNRYSFLELITMPKKDWLIDQLVGSGDIGMVFGPPGCGKTFIIIDLIVIACCGRKWANRFSVKRPLNVAYCAGEGISGLPSRFSASSKHYHLDNLHTFNFYKITPQLFDTQINSTTNSINQFIAEWKRAQQEKECEPLDLLVIDTLHSATLGADENSSQDMGKVIDSCRLASIELGCSVILVHHTNKVGTSERGSSALRGAMDFMIKIDKSDDSETSAIMSCSKLKDGEAWENQSFTLLPVEGSDSVCVSWGNLIESSSHTMKSKDSDRNKILEEMKSYPGKGFTSKSLSEVITKSTPYTIKLLNELIDQGKCLRELSDRDKPNSNRNPWQYRLKK